MLRPKTGRCPMTGHRLCQGRPPHNGWPISVRRQHKLLAKSRPFLPIRFDFRPRIDCTKIVKKKLLETWIMLYVQYDLWVIVYHLCTKTFPNKNNYEWKDWKLLPNWQWTQWRRNTFQATNILLGISSHHCCSGHSCKRLFVWICVNLNTLHTHGIHVLFHYRWLRFRWNYESLNTRFLCLPE